MHLRTESAEELPKINPICWFCLQIASTEWKSKHQYYQMEKWEKFFVQCIKLALTNPNIYIFSTQTLSDCIVQSSTTICETFLFFWFAFSMHWQYTRYACASLHSECCACLLACVCVCVCSIYRVEIAEHLVVYCTAINESMPWSVVTCVFMTSFFFSLSLSFSRNDEMVVFFGIIFTFRLLLSSNIERSHSFIHSFALSIQNNTQMLQCKSNRRAQKKLGRKWTLKIKVYLTIFTNPCNKKYSTFSKNAHIVREKYGWNFMRISIAEGLRYTNNYTNMTNMSNTMEKMNCEISSIFS